MGKIAPHEGQELALVLAGKKPMATLQRAKDPDQYLAVYEESAEHKNIKVQIVAEGEIAFALRPNFNIVRQYVALRNGETPVKDTADYQRKMGKLFGYTGEEIEAFINADIKCNCKDCKGMSNVQVD